MPSGIMQRWQGSVKAAKLWIGNGGIEIAKTGIIISVGDLMTLYGQGSAPVVPSSSLAINPPAGVFNLSTADGTYTLGAPVPGYEPTFYASGATTDGNRKLFSGSTLITFDGTNDVITSSAAGVISLKAVSTTRWLVTGNTGGATFGTST